MDFLRYRAVVLKLATLLSLGGEDDPLASFFSLLVREMFQKCEESREVWLQISFLMWISACEPVGDILFSHLSSPKVPPNLVF